MKEIIKDCAEIEKKHIDKVDLMKFYVIEIGDSKSIFRKIKELEYAVVVLNENTCMYSGLNPEGSLRDMIEKCISRGYHVYELDTWEEVLTWLAD